MNLVDTWCICGVCDVLYTYMVCMWCICGVYVVCMWCTCGTCAYMRRYGYVTVDDDDEHMCDVYF